MKYLLIYLALVMSSAQAESLDKVNQKSWIHGAKDCENNTDPAIDILQVTDSTFILRQNKCIHYEAPFIYVLFGEHTVFVQDTGATAEADEFPLYETLQTLVVQWQQSHHDKELNVLVTHSHSHGDHIAADSQFRDMPSVTLVEPNAMALHQFFGFDDWPNGLASINLGERELIVIPIPGHQEESIAIYDPHTQWLLSGDTFYPGRLYIKDWGAFKSSIERLVAFSETHQISAIMGTHIEMSNVPGEDYPAGSTFQPNETSLSLGVEDLLHLNKVLKEAGSRPQSKTMPKFILSPLSMPQRILGGVLGWARKLVN